MIHYFDFHVQTKQSGFKTLAVVVAAVAVVVVIFIFC